MRVIDKLAEMTNALDIETALDEIVRKDGLWSLQGYTGDFSEIFVREIPEDAKIAVRLITSKGGVSSTVYTYLCDPGNKPHPGSVVQVPGRVRATLLWGIVQPEAALTGSDVLATRGVELRHIVKWVHRHEVA